MESDRLPWICPDHPNAQIRHEYDETQYTQAGGWPMGRPIATNHNYYCAICGRELAAEKPEPSNA